MYMSASYQLQSRFKSSLIEPMLRIEIEIKTFCSFFSNPESNTCSLYCGELRNIAKSHCGVDLDQKMLNKELNLSLLELSFLLCAETYRQTQIQKNRHETSTAQMEHKWNSILTNDLSQILAVFIVVN